ncbi:MAG: PaaI family thioesterase [bacterium]|nr:PaaI family thioesterase [bacterium]
MIQNVGHVLEDSGGGLPGAILASESDPRRVEAALNESAPFRHFGVRARLNPGGAPTATLELPRILPHHRGGTTITSVNGGVIAMICDIAVGLTIVGPGLPVLTGSGVGRLNIRMRRPVEGDSLHARAFIERIRRNLIYSRVEVYDAEDRLCVDATGTVYRSRDTAAAMG